MLVLVTADLRIACRLLRIASGVVSVGRSFVAWQDRHCSSMTTLPKFS
jgi:hypothetical protein